MRIITRDDNGAGGRSVCAFKMLADREFSNWSWDIIYEIETPEPLNMKNGVYHGATSYSRGGRGRILIWVMVRFSMIPWLILTSNSP